MSDITSAEIFGRIFNRLVEIFEDKNSSKDDKEFIWNFTGDLYEMTKDYDFALYQMDCEKALDLFDLGDLDAGEKPIVPLEVETEEDTDGSEEDLSIKTVDFIRGR